MDSVTHLSEQSVGAFISIVGVLGITIITHERAGERKFQVVYRRIEITQVYWLIIYTCTNYYESIMSIMALCK